MWKFGTWGLQRLQHQPEEMELGLKTTKLSIRQGKNPHCGHINIPTELSRSSMEGKKITLSKSQSSSLCRQTSFNLHGNKAPPLCPCKEKQIWLIRGDHLCNKLEYVSCEILPIRLCDSVSHRHHRFQLHYLLCSMEALMSWKAPREYATAI